MTRPATETVSRPTSLRRRAARATPARGGPAAVVLGGVLALALVLVLHLSHGSSEVGLVDLLGLLTGQDGAQARAVLLGARLPRTLAGLVAGGAFGVAGALLQSGTRNPLASPDTLGVTAGAYFTIALAAVLGLPTGILAGGTTAFVGGLAAAALVYLVAAGGRGSPARLVLAGVSVTLLLASATAVLQLLYEQEAGGVFFWGQGSLVVTDSQRSLVMMPLLAAGLLAGVGMARSLDVMATGDDLARGLGVAVRRVRASAILMSVVLTAVGVAVAGPIGFVGLAAPHMVRIAGARRHAALVPASLLWGAVLLLGADLLAQASAPGGGEIPAGVVTALFGAPVFLWLARYLPTGPEGAGAALPGVRPRRRTPYPVLVGVCATVLVVAIGSGLAFGDLEFGPGALLTALTGQGAETVRAVVLEFRAPRVLVAALAGVLLAVAGGCVQSVVRNPLADMTVVGVSGGAALGAVTVLIMAPSAPYATLPVAAFVGGGGAFALTYALARRGGSMSPQRMVLIGIGTFQLTTAAVTFLVLGAQFRLAQALTWLSGSTYARDTDDLLMLIVTAAVTLPLITLLTRHVDLLALGDDTPRTLGLRLEYTRLAVLTLAVAMAAAVTAVVGMVVFVGLIAPHAARLLAGGRTHRFLPVTALLGATLMVVADTVGRVVVAPAEIPSGLLAALIGTPYFVWLLHRESGTGTT